MREIQLNLQDNKKKDGWDKAAIVASLLSSVIIAGLVSIFTLQYQEAESRRAAANQKAQLALAEEQTALRKVEVVAKFIPFLSSNDPEQEKLSIVALYRLADANLAAEFAEASGTDGALQGLQFVAGQKLEKEEQQAVDKAISNVMQKITSLSPKDIRRKLASAVAKITAYDQNGNIRSQCTGWHMAMDWIITADICVKDNQKATAHFGFKDIENKRWLKPEYIDIQVKNKKVSNGVAFFKLDSRPGNRVTSFMIESGEVTVGDQVYLLQHPQGQAQALSECTVQKVTSQTLTYNCDGAGGSAGGPVILARTNKVVAVHERRVNGQANVRQGLRVFPHSVP